MKKLRTAAAILLFLPSLIMSQEKPRIRVYPLVTEGFSEEEARNIEAVFFSYIRDIGSITGGGVFDVETGDFGEDHAPLLQSPQYTVAGRLHQDENSRFLDLEITNENSGERYSFSYPFKSSSELVLRARSVLSRAFSPDQRTAASTTPEPIRADLVRGTWKSGGSIQMIRLEQNGTGMILFSSGAVMRLVYTITDNILTVVQDSPNNERFYHPLPQEVARELAEKADPMRWELELSEQGAVLRGIVVFTEAVYQGNTLSGVNMGKIASVEWQRSR
ncbi:MAG: hypothetical protein LBI67_12920 [Treponema sp.]|nr:hypothetical protein [Treponema sp.]